MKKKSKPSEDFTYAKEFVGIVERNKQKNKVTNFICIDPGIRNVGWCLFNFDDCSVVEFGVISNVAKADSFGNDPRFIKISQEVERLIVLYRPDFCVVEKIAFSKGRNSFSESILLKAVGLITLSIMQEGVPIFEMVNNRAQKLLLEKADNRKSNKDLMKKYVIENLPRYITESKLLSRKVFDTYDAIFIAIAFKEACENCLNNDT